MDGAWRVLFPAKHFPLSEPNHMKKLLLLPMLFSALLFAADPPALPVASTKPQAPALLSAERKDDTKIELTWSWFGEPNDVVAFRLIRRADGRTNETRLISVLKTRVSHHANNRVSFYNYTDDKTRTDSVYVYKVVAITETEESDQSNILLFPPMVSP